MDHLPVEVLANIMQYLSVSDRKELALLNKRWYEASLDPILLQDTVVAFPANAASKQIFGSLVRRKTPHLVLEELDESFQSQLLSSSSMEYLTGHLLSLCLKGSNITESAFLNVITKCHSLEKLDLSCCNSLFMSGILFSKPKDIAAVSHALQHLKELNLSSIRHLTDTMFNRILAAAPNISSLSLASSQIVFTAKLGSYAHNAKSACFSFTNLLKILTERATKIKTLNLGRTSINDDALYEMGIIPKLALEELYLVNCRELTPQGLIRFFKGQPTLTLLDLSQCMDVNDDVIAAVCNNLRNLKHLALKKCSRVSDGSISMLYKLPELLSLDISSCYLVTPKGLNSGLCRPTETSKLRCLTLTCCNGVKDDFFFEAGKSLHEITQLDVASTSISNASLLLISKTMPKLRSLNLSWCKGLSDSGMLGLIESEDPPQYHTHEYEDGQCSCTRQNKRSHIFNKPTKYLPAREFSKMEMEVHLKLESALNNAPVSFGNLRLLENLDLTSCFRLTDDSLAVVLADLGELRFLCLSMCPKLTDKVLFAVAQNNSCLEKLDISHNTNFSDNGLQEVAYRLRRLTSLNISNCDKLTDAGIDHLQRHCKKLRSLDVSFNSSITSKSVARLEHTLKQLQGLRKRLINHSAESEDNLT